MLSNNRDWFMYCSYWRSWNRVLLRMGGGYLNQVEVYLQPHNAFDSEWQNLLQCRIRQHRTVPAVNDVFTHNVPDSVYETLILKFDRETADFFVHTDLYKMIDWELFREVGQDWYGGGGIPIALVIKSQSWLPEKMRTYWEANRLEICENYYAEREKRLQTKLRKLTDKFSTDDTGIIGQMLNYITTADHIWDPTKYVFQKNMKGLSFNKETNLELMYVLGNAYLSGTVGDMSFGLFKNHANFQVYLRPVNEEHHSAQTRFSVTVDKKADLLDFLRNKLSA